MLLIAISDNVDKRAAEMLRKFRDVEVAEHSPQTVVVADDDVFPVRIEVLDAAEIESRIDSDEDHRSSLFVINAVIDDATAARLEDAGANYIDATGRRWLRGSGRTKRANQPAAVVGRRRLYAASVRLAQLLADHPAQLWTERLLAELGHTTQATAHRLLARLEAEDLVVREGRGPSTTRWLNNPAAMRRWLAHEARPQRTTQLACFVRDPEYPRPVVGRALALTGAAAATEIGLPVLTQASIPMMRVNAPADELEDIPEALGGFRTDSGPNLILVADPDRLAFVDASPGPGNLLLAPPSRIMLDLYLEARGDAAVDVFLDLWGDRRISL